MPRARVLAPALALALAAPAAATGDGPSFDCAATSSEAEAQICADPGLAALDRRLAGHYAAALLAAEADGTEAADTLRAEQRGWIKGRDACAAAGDPRACLRDAYLMREGALVAGWMLEAPRATAVWTCGGAAANEVVTMFFDTELPSLRFERGDETDTGSLVRTASGSKYEGSFGRSIWIKGDAATYRAPDPDGTELDCTLAREE